MKKTIFFGLLLIGCAAQAQPQWPAMTQTAKPWTRWWWMGSAVDNQNLTRLMEQYKQAGLGGVEITPIYGVKGEEKSFIPFLSPTWMDRLGHTLAEAKRLNLGVDLAQASGWPFGGLFCHPGGVYFLPGFVWSGFIYGRAAHQGNWDSQGIGC